MTSNTPALRRLLPVLLLLAAPAFADVADFPRPAELERDVQFWLRVFTATSTNEGLLHDNRNLAVVYEVVPMPEKTARRDRNNRVAARRKHYESILNTLASGKRSGLSADEQRVLDLWGDEATNETLAAAAGQIRFQHGLSDRFAESIGRAGLWRDHVNASFSRHGVPVELAALPHVESSYNPAARSHVGASGIWQFTQSTGRRFMQVDHVIDARNDPYLASDAAARLLAYNYSLTQNWPMAITAYNHGLAGVRRAMRQHGDTAYVDILRNYRGRTFGFASRNFYVAFLAALEVDRNAATYFPGVSPRSPVAYETFELDQFMPVDAVTRALGISAQDFGEYNPALQPTIMQGSKYLPRGFELRVPRDRIAAPASELLMAIADNERFAEQLPDMFHTIRRGDTLSHIADMYDTSVTTLVALNSLSSRHRIRAGQQLRLPAAGPAPAPAVLAAPAPAVMAAVAPVHEPPMEVLADVPATDSGPAVDTQPVEGILGEEAGATEMETLEAALLSDPSDYSVADDLSIEVQPLETLGHYADWLGIRTQRLRDVNGLAFRAPVVVGQRIRLEVDRSAIGEFERKRAAYHKEQQDAFFRRNTITGVQEHVVASGESLWVLALRRYGVPVWLFRQYNPEVDMHRVRIGTQVSFPVLDPGTG